MADTLGRLIQFKQGSRISLPELKSGEPAFCDDDKTVWIGSNTGNKEFAVIGSSIVRGSITILPSLANVPTSEQITWNMNNIPFLALTPANNNPRAVSVSYSNKTTTGFTLWVTSNNTEPVTIDYIAIV